MALGGTTRSDTGVTRDGKGEQFIWMD